MKKILVTGGPVHAYLDAVKIITNHFKGGLMCDLATILSRFGAKVVYVCPSEHFGVPLPEGDVKVLRHDGFEDYRRIVKKFAPEMDAVILGAAVANLIPADPIKGKFPSHNYKPGDIVPINFKIAPRVIDDVKVVAPRTHLFGFKLLAGVSQEELIRAAYGIVLEAKATAVIANDRKELDKKLVVTKERSVHPMNLEDVAPWIWQMINDEYYSTRTAKNWSNVDATLAKVTNIVRQYRDRFTVVEGGFIFGTVAARTSDTGFVTTSRGKRELDTHFLAYVDHVDRKERHVYSAGGKASLNAPLLAKMFQNPAVDHIVHYHEQVEGLPSYPYAPPGTVRDSDRPSHTSFNIKEHGCMLLFDKTGKQL